MLTELLPAARSRYFRIFLDAQCSDAGTADEPVDVDGDDDVAARRAKAESRRYALLEEEVLNTRQALDIARSKAEEAQQKALERQKLLNEQRKVMQEQDMVHSHDKAEAANWKRKYDRLHDEHVKLSDQAEKWRVIHDQRAKAEKIANDDADFDPAIDRPEVLKWANKQLVSVKAELKRQLSELRTENERLQKAADVAKKRLERQKEKERERRAHEREHGGTCDEMPRSRSSKHRAGAERAGAAVAGAVAAAAAPSAEDLVAPLGDLLPPRRESSKLAPVLLADAAETSATFDPPESPGDSGGAVPEAAMEPSVTRSEMRANQGKSNNERVQEPRADEDTAWAAALLEEEGGWAPPGAEAVHNPSVEASSEQRPSASVADSPGITRTMTLVEQAVPRASQAHLSPQHQYDRVSASNQRRRPHGAAFGFAGVAAAAAVPTGNSAGAAAKAALPIHPISRPVPAEFLGWTAAAGSKRGKQVMAAAALAGGGGGIKLASKSGTGAASKSAKRMKLLASGRGHTPKVSSFFK